MISFQIGGHSYQAGKILPFDQLAIAKRMMPVMKNILTPEVLASVVNAGKNGDGGSGINLSALDLHAIIPAMCDAIYSLSDDDAERIIRTALKVVQRQNEGGVWSNITTPQGLVMFDDIDLPTMLQISWKVIEEHLGSFFNTAR